MSSSRPALLLCGALLVGGLVAQLAWTPTAEAAPAAPMFAGTGLLELLRPTDLVGDGATPAEMWFYALDPKGAPITGWKVKLAATNGTVGELVEAGGGLYRFTFTPVATETATTATIELRGKFLTKEVFYRTWTVPVAPPRNHGVSTVVNPTQMTLGVDKTANVAVTVTGGTPVALSQVKLVHNVTPGTITGVTHLGNGRFDALYTAPTGAGAVAQIALLTFADAGDATRTYSSVAVPLTAQVVKDVKVAPKAQVVLKVAGRDFGPVAADSKGRAKVPIVIPPGVTGATQVVVAADGSVKEEPLDLKLPETRRIALFPTAATLPADGRAQVPVRAIVVTPDGKPDEAAQVVFSASAGEVGPSRHEGGGIYVATYTPPFANAASKITLSAKLADASAVQADTLPVDLVAVRATGLALAADPPTLPAGATGFTLSAKVTGPNGAALAGRNLGLSANGAKLVEVKDLKDGAYTATYTTTGKGPVEITAHASTPSLQNPLAHVVLVPSREHLPPDGLSSTMLTVATLDDYGYPVPDVDVDLRLLSGDGALPATIRTNADGIAKVFYTAGRTTTFVAIEAVAGDRSAGASLLQAPATLTVPDLPVAGSAATAARAADVVSAMSSLRIERQ